jgi:DNA-binding winged helix-turn-helix (wHTH) protein/TolB-like protein
METAMVQSGDIIFLIEQGKVVSNDSEARLTPINMKVLHALLNSEGEVMSRANLFDIVWGEQQVSDDSLTRSISDIRQQLKRLSPNVVFIETIPKRGYRWKQSIQPCQDESTVETLQMDQQNIPHSTRDSVVCPASDLSNPSRPSNPANPANPKNIEPSLSTINSNDIYFSNSQASSSETNNSSDTDEAHFRWSQLLNLKLLFAGSSIALVIFIGLFFTLQMMFRPQNIIILLPMQTEEQYLEIANILHENLSQQIIRGKDFKLLTQSVLRQGSSNHFKYLSNEYRARYAIEGLVRQQGQNAQMTLNLIDARTAIILESTSISANEDAVSNFVKQFLLNMDAK